MTELGPVRTRFGDIARTFGVKGRVAFRRSWPIAKGMIYSPAYGDIAFTVPASDVFLRCGLRDWR